MFKKQLATIQINRYKSIVVHVGSFDFLKEYFQVCLSILSAQKVSEATNEKCSAEIVVRQVLLQCSCSATIVKILE